MGITAVSVKDLSFSYRKNKEKKAVKNINLDIPKGQFVVIMGPSGAGKSTFANSLNGLIPNFSKGEYSGEVLINDINPAKGRVSAISKTIGLVFQDFESQLFSTNTSLEIAFGPENFNVESDEIQKRIDDIMQTVDLIGFEHREPSTLSGGQKQRIAIASVLSTFPAVVCMDEPTTDLDPVGKLGIFEIAKKLHQNTEFTLIIIEHETEEALSADRLILMKDGVVVEDGKPHEVLKNVELTDDIGIMSLQIPKFYKQFSNLENIDLPLVPQAGADFFGKNKFKIDNEKYDLLLQKDKKRQEIYGDVLVEVKNLVHTYPNGKTAVDDISLKIRENEFIAVLGHNGSGKTTLVKHFNGLLNPSEGDIVICNKNTKENSIFEIGKDIGYVFQNPDHQIFADTVEEEVGFSPKIRGCSKEEVAIRIKEALKAVDMEGFEEKDPFSLTKGERQRIAVASVLSARPKIIILDEPTTGLDYTEQKKMMELIKKLNESGHTIIMITHTMWVVSEYAHSVAVIKDGKMESLGSTREIFSKEKELANAFLKVPHICSMGNLLGKTVLSIDEMNSITIKE